ncbi:MAG TPA: radical SAM protein [Gemmatales bacterium]|nr:radical SAM protein [Gemmatales bacterium]
MLRRSILFLQLPIPPLGPGRLRGNVPLAAGYLKMYAEQQGLQADYDIQILPSALSNTLSEQGLIEAILERDPWMVGFTCYLWNIDRTLWIANQLKQRRPELVVVIGGPEVTIDNAWVLQQAAVDYYIIGEGEQTFAELLQAIKLSGGLTLPNIPGLHAPRTCRPYGSTLALQTVDDPKNALPGFLPRHPLENLDQISSPYLAGILDAADEEMLLLETIRGCIFKCKFCYYPKAYTGLHFLSKDKIIANLRHGQERGAKEIVMLDPTLNQRKDFDDFLRLLIAENPGRRFSFFGELRAEGIKPTTAQLLAEANFTEVEVGLQSIDPLAMQLMDRKNNLKAVEKGCQAMLAAGIKVKVDLIIGLPGDTVDSVRRSMHYLRDSGIYSDVQVFNLAVLPGTAFRQEAPELGLIFQPRPPYYVRSTPTMTQQDLFMLMEEAAEVFDIEWDPVPEYRSQKPGVRSQNGIVIDLADFEDVVLPAARDRQQVYTLWFRSPDFDAHIRSACRWIRRVLDESPFTTLQVILEPTALPLSITSDVLGELWAACQKEPSYMDRYYAMQPGRPIGAKRLVVMLEDTDGLPEEWLDAIEEQATIVTNTIKECAIS